MSARTPRIAYFPDSYHEINGVAHTSRNFAAYAQSRGLPFLLVCAGSREPGMREPVGQEPVTARHESFRSLELPRSRMSIPMELDLEFDPLFLRHASAIEEALHAFRPDVIHITGPSELGIFGAYFAWKLGVPLAASWHTNVHEYAARRMLWLSRHLRDAGPPLEEAVEAGALDATMRFYRLARVVYAPNPELCALLERGTGRPCHLMQRGVDTALFSPAKRTRGAGDAGLVLGYTGRLSVEKNVALLPRVHAELQARGISARWLIAGHGAEEEDLRRGLGDAATFVGVLRGEALAAAYADMDLFVFPSHTDTFGNVVLEALASGVPAVVTPDGGPAYIVRDRHIGRVAHDQEFAAAIAGMHADHETRLRMSQQAREEALRWSWEAVFDRVVSSYPVEVDAVTP